MNYTEFYLTKFAAAPVTPVDSKKEDSPSTIKTRDAMLGAGALGVGGGAAAITQLERYGDKAKAYYHPGDTSVSPAIPTGLGVAKTPGMSRTLPPNWRETVGLGYNQGKERFLDKLTQVTKSLPKSSDAMTGAAIATLGDATLRASGTNPVVSSALTGAVAGQGFVPRNASPKTRAIAGGIGAIANAAKNLYTNSSFFLPNKAPVPAAPVPAAPAPAPVIPLPDLDTVRGL